MIKASITDEIKDILATNVLSHVPVSIFRICHSVNIYLKKYTYMLI